MIWYPVQPRDRIFVKGYGFLSFAKNMCKNIGENISKSLSSKYSPGMLAMRQKLLDHAKQSATDAFKTAKATVDLIGNKIANKILGAQKVHTKVIQKQLQMSMIKKYLEKDLYLQKNDKKLLMNWDQSSIITEYQKIIKVSKSSQQNSSETVTNENDKEIPKERYVSRRKTENYW